MSSYRRLDTSLPIAEDQRGDAYPFRSKRSAQKESLAVVKGDKAEEAYKQLRKNQPANIALPRTKTWFEGLPPQVRPTALMRQFPRIANVIAAAWNDLEQFETYISSLLTDKRGGRKGFPGEVLMELGALDRYRHSVPDGAAPWCEVGRRG
jgi:hypothetical protein